MAASDVVLIAVLVFAAAIGLFAIFSAFTPAIDALEHSPLNESATALTALDGSTAVLAKADYLILGVFIAFSLGLVITSWFIAGNPLYMFVYFIVVVVSVVVGAVLSNVWETVTNASVFGTNIGSFPIANHLMMLLPYYLGIIGFLGIVVIFAKPYVSEGGGF